MNKAAYLVNLGCVAEVTNLDGGTIEFYTTPQPATVDDPPGSATLIATIDLGDPAFAAPTNGVASAATWPASQTATPGGTPTWVRFKDSFGVATLDATCGIGGSFEVQVSKAVFLPGDVFTFGTITYTVPRI